MEPNKELAELAESIEDVTEPASMEILLIYLEQLQMDDDDFMQLLIERVNGYNITWDQPWYQQSNCLTRPLVFESGHKSIFRNDSFCKAESKLLAKNWKHFRKMFQLPDTPICLARWRNRNKSRNPNTPEEKARQFAIAFLAQGLERNLYQVYKYFVTLYGAPVKGAYSKTEQKIIEICYHHEPGKAVPYLAAILGREPRGISKRLQTIHQGKLENKRIKWTLPIATKLVQSLIQHSGKSLDELKDARFDKSVWIRVQEDMDHPYIYLQKFWYSFLHVQLFVKYDVKLKRLRRKIFKKLQSTNYQVWTDIRWKEILKEFPEGFTHLFLYFAVHSLVKKYPNKYLKAPLKDVVEFGLNKLNSNKSHKKRLRTLALNEEGDLEVINNDEKMP